MEVAQDRLNSLLLFIRNEKFIVNISFDSHQMNVDKNPFVLTPQMDSSGFFKYLLIYIRNIARLVRSSIDYLIQIIKSLDP